MKLAQNKLQDRPLPLNDREHPASSTEAASPDADLIGTAVLEEEQARQDNNIELDLDIHQATSSIVNQNTLRTADVAKMNP